MTYHHIHLLEFHYTEESFNKACLYGAEPLPLAEFERLYKKFKKIHIPTWNKEITKVVEDDTKQQNIDTTGH